MDSRDTHYDKRWRLLTEGRQSTDAPFFYGVKTTGIFCVPGCASRRPRKENVEFFETPAAARTAGYRPCKRCNPEGERQVDEKRKKIIAACRRIEASEDPLSVAELADESGYSPGHFQRIFKEVTGMSPKQYSLSIRQQRLTKSLQTAESVTDAIYESGFGSASRMYGQARRKLAMKPREYRDGAAGIQIGYALFPCDLGWVLVAMTPEGVCAIELGDTPEELREALGGRFPGAELEESRSIAEETRGPITELMNAGRTSAALPLDIRGTVFQEKVWRALQEIPPGETRSYAEIAARIGEPKAARAVANACSANPLAVAIPCHRAVRQDGGSGGYRWGAERKRALLKREQEKRRDA